MKTLIRSSNHCWVRGGSDHQAQKFGALWRCSFFATHQTNRVPDRPLRELHLQLHLLELQSLVAQAASEFRLKGPFPVSLYRGILASLQTILDNLHSIRCGEPFSIHIPRYGQTFILLSPSARSEHARRMVRFQFLRRRRFKHIEGSHYMHLISGDP